MYAGTGEGFFNADSVRGFGIFKSIDGGTTWNLLSSTNPTTAGADWYYVNRVAVNGSLILAATRGGVYRSADGGTTWTKTYTTSSGYGAMDVKFDPNNFNNAIVGEKGGKTSYSTNGGASWTAAAPMGSATGFYGRVELAYARSVSGTVYASVDSGNGQIYKSVNGGATWALVSTPAHTGAQGWYDNAIWVDPTNANHVLIGGLDIKRSTDGGVTFTNISTWYYAPSSAHADHHAIVADPDYDGLSNRKIYFGNDGGIYRAADIALVNSSSSSNGWTNLNNGLAITQFYGGAGHASAGAKIAGGTQDNGSLVYSGTANGWGTMFGGDGGYSAADSADPNYLYGEYVYLNIHRSSNGGVSSSYIHTGIADANSSGANFIAPFVLDPNNNNRMLGGGLSLWESVNVKAGTPTWASKKASTGSKISSIAIAEGNPNIVWVGHNDGSVYKTTNATSTSPIWDKVRTAGGRTTLRIVIDRDNSSIAYVTYGGYAAANALRTVDAGATWTDISGTLPQVPIRGFARYPGNSNWLYAGTEVGVFASTDAGTTWSVINDGPANVSVDELFWFDDNTLIAVTHGRGMFKTTISSAPLTYSLALSKGGTGGGTVTSIPAGINCGSTCSANYASGTNVTLTAAANVGSVFTSWTGACSGASSTCTVSMTATRNVSANFTASSATRSVSVTKTGSGTVTSNPSGISCGASCSAATASFPSTSSLAFTAAPDSGNTFSGWSGACTGTGNCTIAAGTGSVSLGATFTPTGGSITVLQNGVAVTGLSGVTGSSALYSIDVPVGATNLVISTSGGTGDVDLYTRVGQVPTTSVYDCRPFQTGNTESCSVGTPVSGTYFVLLHGFASYSGAAVVASYTSASGAATPTYRFRNPFTGGHFFTSNEGEKAYVLANLPAYQYEGVGFYTYAAQATNSFPIYRFSNSQGFHYFTISETEKNQLLTDQNYRFDGIAFYGFATQVSGSAPVYRFRNSITGSSFYTARQSEYEYVLANLPSYIYQNIVFYVRMNL
jgi:hypothetical protein